MFPESLFTNRQFMVNPDFELYHYKSDEPIEVDLHHHDFNEIFILLSGDVDYFIDGKVYNLSPGDMLLINSSELHRPYIKPGAAYERIVFFIRPEFILSRNAPGANLMICFESNKKDYNHLLHPQDEMYDTIKETLTKIFMISNSSEYASEVLKELYITEFLIYVNQSFISQYRKTKPPRVQNKLLDKIIDYIAENINGDLSLDTLAGKFFISKYHLAHQFKNHTGISLHQFVKYKRLLIARSLLREGSSVTDTCALSGFGDYNNFIRSFKQMYNTTPKAYASSEVHSHSRVE